MASRVRAPADLAAYNANYVGGDIITGANTPVQLLIRPRLALDPYSTGAPGLFICSAATPPGAGAHGMGGFNAARSALRHLGSSGSLASPEPDPVLRHVARQVRVRASLVMADVRGTGPGSEGSGAGARRENWSRRIGEALERDLFVLHAQRIVDVASGETVRHELFLRMVDGERLIPAGEFVLAAEELGSIREVDRWVVGRAIEVASAGHPVDLNLSVRSLDDPLLELIRHRTGETGADPGDLVLELSEEQLVGRGRGGGGVRPRRP